MRTRITVLMFAVLGTIGFATPSAMAASNEDHSSCIAALTSYFKEFGMSGEVGPLFSSLAKEEQPFGRTTIRDRAAAKFADGGCD